MIKNILFDLGGILYDVDYHRTIDAFNELGFSEFEGVYSQAAQGKLFDDFEKGKISEEFFFQEIKRLGAFDGSISDMKIAWNKMLLQFNMQNWEDVKTLKKDYNLAFLSNTNETHIAHVENDIDQAIGLKSFHAMFERGFYSHIIEQKKPDPTAFQWVLNQLGWKAEETLFIEDSIQHIEGAASIGMKTYHSKSNSRFLTHLPL